MMSTGLQGAGSRTRRAWVIEAEDGGGVTSMRCACQHSATQSSQKRLWALMVGGALLTPRTVSVEYLGSHLITEN